MVEVIQADRDRLHEMERYLHVSHSGPFLTDDALDVLARHRIEAQSEIQAELEVAKLHAEYLIKTHARTDAELQATVVRLEALPEQQPLIEGLIAAVMVNVTAHTGPSGKGAAAISVSAAKDAVRHVLRSALSNEGEG